mmetsp:Transcript_36559/g.113104  ORF Transcript_36559/g.113104 Transcript_36559/m.113104 type:complete len:410 (-) Transcript_36559:50-1279(-)
MSVEAALAEADSMTTQQQHVKYNALVDALAASGDAGGLRTVLDRLLSDEVSQAVSRPAAARVAAACANLKDDAARLDVCRWAVERVKPQVQSFEEADYALRQALFACLLEAGDFRDAAMTLGGINVETSAKQYTEQEKAALYVQVAETFLEEDESVDAETYVTRASGLMRGVPQSDWTLHLRYRVTLAKTLDSRRKFLDAAMRYYELSQAQHEALRQEELVNLLCKAVTCALLGNAGPQRSRILGLLYKDERVTNDMERSEEYAAHARVLKRTVTGQLVRNQETAAFTATLLPHQKALLADGLTIPEAAMIQHNLVAVSHVYVNVSVDSVAKLLDVDARRIETVASKMISSGRLAAKLDQVDGLLVFTDDPPPLVRFDEAIARLCLNVNACYEKAIEIQDAHEAAAAKT